MGLGVGNEAPYHCVALLFVLIVITIAYYIMVTWFYNEEQICNSSFFLFNSELNFVISITLS